MNINEVINDFSSGIYYAKDKLLCYVDKTSNNKRIRCSEFEYQLLKNHSLNITRKERKHKRFNFILMIIALLVALITFFIVDASILYARGLSIDNYIRVRLMNQVIVTDGSYEVRLALIDAIKRDFPGIRLNESEISILISERSNNQFGAAYLTSLFAGDLILLYQNTIDYKAHEIIHHLSNSGVYVGWKNRFSTRGRAMNEGMTEFLKVKYIPETRVVYREKFYINALINIFGEERMIRSFFSGNANEIESLLNTYSNGFDLIRIMDEDHIRYNNTDRIEEYIIQIFLSYLQSNQGEIADFNTYVDTFIDSMTLNHSKERSERLQTRIVTGVLAINGDFRQNRI